MSTLKVEKIQHPNSASVALTLDTSGNLALQAGSAAAPAIQGPSDPNTGIFFPAADTIAFAEGGVERARLDSSGRLLVGTSTASGSALLQVLGDAQVASINGGPIGGARNRIINGDMRIDQRNAGASVTPTNGSYTLDRWSGNVTQASKFTVQQNAGAVTPPTSFSNYLGVTSTSAYSITSSDAFSVFQVVEGLNSGDLAWGTANAAPVTLSFWVRSSLTGTFGGSLRNSAVNRSYPFSYSVSSTNTWELKTIAVPGDTSGTWLTTNGVGIILTFGFGVGSTFSGTAGAWGAGNFVSATGATSIVGTNGATFYITGVQLEAGTVATPFERRSYGQELALCQRYYWQVGGVSGELPFVGQATSTVRAHGVIQFPVEMRAAPSTTVSANSDWSWLNAASTTGFNWTSFTATFATPRNTYIAADVASGLVAGNATMCQATTANARLRFSSEL